jgi:hypothetical protein
LWRDPPGQWRRNGAFEDRADAQAHADALAAGDPEVEAAVVGVDDDVACS